MATGVGEKRAFSGRDVLRGFVNGIDDFIEQRQPRGAVARNTLVGRALGRTGFWR